MTAKQSMGEVDRPSSDRSGDLGEDDDLGAEDEAGAEADLQG
jgi:hypothetical protein